MNHSGIPLLMHLSRDACTLSCFLLEKRCARQTSDKKIPSICRQDDNIQVVMFDIAVRCIVFITDDIWF